MFLPAITFVTGIFVDSIPLLWESIPRCNNTDKGPNPIAQFYRL
jgi:hypothetical protein